MRAILRVGVGVGVAGCIALASLQLVVGLVVLPGLVAVGALAGLAMAKWLDWSWYGRQGPAGLRAGAIASGIAATGTLVSLLLFGPHNAAILLGRSHLASFDLAPRLARFSGLGWIGLDVLGVLVCGLFAVVLAVMVTEIGAWSKSGRAVRVVTQARQTALALQRGETWEPVLGSLPALLERGSLTGMLGEVSGALLAAPYTTGTPTSAHSGTNLSAAFAAFAPATPTEMGSGGRPGESMIWPPPNVTPALGVNIPSVFDVSAPVRRGPPPAPHVSLPTPPPAPPVAPARRTMEPERPQPTEPAATPNTATAGARPVEVRRAPRKRSSKRQAEADMTVAMRAALAAWAEQEDTLADNRAGNPVNNEMAQAHEREWEAEQEHASADVAPAARAPVSSEYLNSATPRPKRNRKKQQTRDWLC